MRFGVEFKVKGNHWLWLFEQRRRDVYSVLVFCFVRPRIFLGFHNLSTPFSQPPKSQGSSVPTHSVEKEGKGEGSGNNT